MNDDQCLVIRHHVPPRTQILHFIRVHSNAAVRSGKLQQAEFRAVRKFRHEFRIKRHQPSLLNVVAKVLKFGLIGNQRRSHLYKVNSKEVFPSIKSVILAQLLRNRKPVERQVNHR